MHHAQARAPAQRDPALICLALLYGLGGVACLSGAIRPPNPHVSIQLNAALGAIGIGVSGVLYWTARQDTLRHLHTRFVTVSLVVNIALTCTLMWGAGTQAGQILTGFNFIYLTMLTAYFLPRPVSRTFAGLMVAGTLTTTYFSPVVHEVRAGPVISMAVILVGEVLGALVGQIRGQATIDDLTGALNRGALRVAADRALATAQRTSQPLAVLLLDLDGFKIINDQYGHAAGDALLADIAQCWRGVLRGEDTLARIGGDEFVALLTNATRHDAETVVRRMRAAHPARWSCGIATSSPGDDLSSLYARADAELYQQKAVRS